MRSKGKKCRPTLCRCASLATRHNFGVALVIFDLDGTLLNSDSTTHWFLYRYARSPLRLGAALLALPAALLLIRPGTRKHGASVFSWIASFSLSEPALHTSFAEFADRVRNGESWLRFHDAGMRTLERHLQQGDRVVIATAAPAWLAEALFHPLRDRIDVIGSTLQERAGGYVFGHHCYGEAKIHALRERGFGAHWQVAYTDSLADRPLLQRADRGFVINASRAMLRVVQAQGLGALLRW